MIPSLSQETITEYASEAQTIQEPQGTDYTQGVRVGRTVPAKWWNWLFRGTTRRLGQAKTDAQNMLTEMQNVVTDAGFTPVASDSHQMSKSVVKDADTQIGKYVEDKKALYTLWFANSTVVNGTNCILSKNTLQQLDNSHMLALFRTVSYPSSEPGNIFYVCTSTDGINWDVIYTKQINYLSIGAVYFNGQYYLLIAFRENNQDVAVLLSSQNCTEWSTVFSHTEELPSSFRKNAWISVAGDMLLIQECDNRSIHYSLDGTNFASMQVGGGWATFDPPGDVLYSNILPAYQLTETKYVVLKYCVDISDRTILSSAYEIYDDYYGSTKLLDGTVAVYYSTNYSGTDKRTTLFKPDGTVGYTSEYVVRDGIDGYLVSPTNDQKLTPDGGSTVIVLPTDLYIRTVLDGVAVLTKEISSGTYAIYNKTDVLTSNIDDYTVVYTWKVTEHGFSPYVIQKGILIGDIRALAVNYGSGTAREFSFDYGHTWRKVNGVEPYVPVTVSIKGGVYAENAYSTPQINKVSGFTLYLR